MYPNREQLYPNWEHSHADQRVAILHDGVVQAVVNDDNAAFAWLAKGNHSVSYQVTHNGWSVRPATPEEIQSHA